MTKIVLELTPKLTPTPRGIVRAGLCIGCGSCTAQAAALGLIAAMDWDRYGQYKPSGDHGWINKGFPAFEVTCPFSSRAPNENQLGQELFPSAPEWSWEAGRFIAAYVGFAAEENFRSQASSGGMLSWLLCELLRRQLIDGVLHVRATEDPVEEGKLFRYTVSRSESEIRGAAKSRYYPVEMSGVLAALRATPGRYAVVGVPCFIKAIQLLRREDVAVRQRVAFTMGLFCGHMKSARFVESFAWQMGVPLREVKSVDFRAKDPSRPATVYTARLVLRDGSTVQRDWWNLADGDWGAGFFQNSACDFCDDVVAETADVSFGDAWVEPYSSDGRGTNVVIVRTEAINNIFAEAMLAERVTLQQVEGDFVASTQAAGLRQRREGLAYRLAKRSVSRRPIKRVLPGADQVPSRRRLIYRMRRHISSWSHRVSWLAHALNRPRLYVLWARQSLVLYHGIAYSRGKIGAWLEKLRFFSSPE